MTGDGPLAAEFSMASEPEHLAGLRAWLRQELARHDLAAEDQGALVVAVGELCTNAIQHAYGGAGGQPIRVSLRAFDDRLVIEVEHFGTPFDAARYVPPDLEAMPERGLGLHLVHQLADDVSFDAGRERGTCWTLVKYRRHHGGPDSRAGAGRSQGPA